MNYYERTLWAAATNVGYVFVAVVVGLPLMGFLHWLGLPQTLALAIATGTLLTAALIVRWVRHRKAEKLTLPSRGRGEMSWR